MDDDDFKLELIELVREHESLWNPKSFEYKNKNFINETWRKITMNLGRDDVKKVRKTWKTLRTQFLREIKAGRTQWKFYKPLDFIESVIKKTNIKKSVIKAHSDDQPKNIDVPDTNAYADDDLGKLLFSEEMTSYWNEIPLVLDPQNSVPVSVQETQSSEVSTSVDHFSTEERVSQTTKYFKESDSSDVLFVRSLIEDIQRAKSTASLKSKIWKVISNHPTNPRRTPSQSSQSLRMHTEMHSLLQVISNGNPGRSKDEKTESDDFILVFVYSLVPDIQQAESPVDLKYKIWKTISEHHEEELEEEKNNK